MRHRTLAALVVCVAAVAPYLSSLDNYFVQDDFGVVSLLSQKPATSFFGWFASTWMDDIWGYTPDEIRPFPAVTYQVTAWWGAASPVANHVLNIALHAANALLVLAIGMAAAGLSLPVATGAAVVFAVLPVHPETVAWVTGRVDSMPAFFYLAAFLAYVGWRRAGGSPLYIASLALFFVALFSKQNTVTLPVALLLYDMMAGGHAVRVSWAWLRPYGPFVALTAGFLLLRYLLFGEVARESQLTAQTVRDFFIPLASRHVRRLVAGQVVPFALLAAPLAVTAVVVCAISFLSDTDRWTSLRRAIYFGVIWTALGIAPTLVANYESPRHIYLASVGWALGAGIAAEVVWQARPRLLMRAATVVAAMLLIGGYVVQLRASVREWDVRAAVSRQATRDLEREALAAPTGSLVILGVPSRSWEWALPFAARPPFARVDLTERVSLLTPMRLHCCRSQWDGYTRRTLEEWSQQPGPPPVIVLAWDPETGAMSRVTDREEPFLRSLMLALKGAGDAQALEGGLNGAIAITTGGERRGER